MFKSILRIKPLRSSPLSWGNRYFARNSENSEHYFVNLLHRTSHNFDGSIKDGKFLEEEIPTYSEGANSCVDPFVVADPTKLIFFKPSRIFRDNYESLFTWIAGRFDATGYVYFEEDIPTTQRCTSKYDHNESIEEYYQREANKLIPNYWLKSDTKKVKDGDISLYHYMDHEDRLASYNWPKRVVEILFDQNDAHCAYYLKLLLRHSYVVKRTDGHWAWRCGDDRGIARLLRVLCGRLYTHVGQMAADRLAREIGLARFDPRPLECNWTNNNWLSGFIEFCGRFRCDIVGMRPYFSVVSKDLYILEAIAALFKFGRITKYKPPKNNLVDAAEMSNIFSDYNIDDSFFQEYLKDESGTINIHEFWWSKKEEKRFKSHPEMFLGNILSKGLDKSNDTSYNSRQFRRHEQRVLYQLIIDNREGMANVSNYILNHRFKSRLAQMYQHWHRIILFIDRRYDIGNKNALGMNILNRFIYNINSYPDADPNVLLQKRELPYKSLYDCTAPDDDFWILQKNESLLEKTCAIIPTSPVHPIARRTNRRKFKDLIFLPQSTYKTIMKKYKHRPLEAFENSYISTEPLGKDKDDIVYRYISL